MLVCIKQYGFDHQHNNVIYIGRCLRDSHTLVPNTRTRMVDVCTASIYANYINAYVSLWQIGISPESRTRSAITQYEFIVDMVDSDDDEERPEMRYVRLMTATVTAAYVCVCECVLGHDDVVA